jgi:hypothetical protein
MKYQNFATLCFKTYLKSVFKFFLIRGNMLINLRVKKYTIIVY